MGLHWTFGRGGGHEEKKGAILRGLLLPGSDHSAGGGMEGQATHKSQGLPTPQFF